MKILTSRFQTSSTKYQVMAPSKRPSALALDRKPRTPRMRVSMLPSLQVLRAPDHRKLEAPAHSRAPFNRGASPGTRELGWELDLASLDVVASVCPCLKPSRSKSDLSSSVQGVSGILEALQSSHGAEQPGPVLVPCPRVRCRPLPLAATTPCYLPCTDPPRGLISVPQSDSECHGDQPCPVLGV